MVKSENLILRTLGSKYQETNQSIKEKEKQSMPWELKNIIEVLDEGKNSILHHSSFFTSFCQQLTQSIRDLLKGFSHTSILFFVLGLS